MNSTCADLIDIEPPPCPKDSSWFPRAFRQSTSIAGPFTIKSTDFEGRKFPKVVKIS
jgi:hypothetical protein